MNHTEATNEFEVFLNQQSPFPQSPQNLYEPCRYILGLGGKRIRPSLCLMAADMFGYKSEDIKWVALAFELFHNFTLIHDDIMDNAPLRRGKETIHEKYGIPTGILSGDVMNIYAYKCLNKINKDKLAELLSLFNQTAIEVCEGQQFDMDFEKLDEVTSDMYLEMIKLKTSVLIAACLKSGAILADEHLENQEKIYNFGINLGIAFQLQDDYLDTFGDDGNTGKQVGGDILADKKTILWITALELANMEDKTELLALKSLEGKDKIRQTIELFEKLKVNDIVNKHIMHYTNLAYQSLDEINVGSDKKEPLKGLATKLLRRKY